MINIDDPNQIEIKEFVLPFSGRLDPHNKWIRLSMMIPWEELAGKYTRRMCKYFGRLSIKPRVAIGALIIKHYKQMSDEDTIQDIQENPYLQYLLGYSSYQFKPCFDPSLFVTIRRRLKAREIEAINEVFIEKVKELRVIEKETKRSQKRSGLPKDNNNQSKKLETTEKKNKGKLIVDATVAPSNIKYPTDLDLLNDSRVISEYFIDTLYSSSQFSQKPRTYRRLARRDYLRIIKKKRKSKKVIRLGIRQQLQYLRRNLSHIENMLAVLKDQPEVLSRKELERLEVIRTIFRQQQEMYLNRVHTVKDRIVSIHQPQIRPMVRGKANADVEFGPKLSLSVVDGFLYLDHLRWNSFNESLDLIAQVNKYRRRFGHFPKVVIADNIYGTRENRKYLKEKGIRFSGKKLGRPPKEVDVVAREMERLRVLEQGERNEVEGKIGTAKTRYGLGKLMTKTEITSDNWVAMAIFSMNMATALRRLLLSLFYWVKNRAKIVINLSLININPKTAPVVSG
ncbi:MAG: IS5 family transposase [Candidatus Marinimicrobia bacterium]|nr:IS5 family transposase [Candidatus Neomarinimicrobiota bacterium]